VIEAGLLALDPASARVVYIRNTLDLETFWVSPTLRTEVESHPHLTIIGEAQPLCFDEDGVLGSPAGNNC
jgi:hypothetical protein